MFKLLIVDKSIFNLYPELLEKLILNKKSFFIIEELDGKILLNSPGQDTAGSIVFQKSISVENDDKNLSEVPEKLLDLMPEEILMIAANETILQIDFFRKITTIFLSLSIENRIMLQNRYPNIIYICDSVNEFINFVEYIIKKDDLTNSDIKKINDNPTKIIINLLDIKEKLKEEISKFLYTTYILLMDGRDLSSFASQFTNTNAKFKNVIIFINALVKPVGFILVSGYELVFPQSKQLFEENSNLYCVCESLVCLLPEIQNNRYLGETFIQAMDSYHRENPRANIVLFESMLNYKSYEAALRNKPAFPSPLNSTNYLIDAFMIFLEKYFNYGGILGEKYVVRTISDLRIKPSSNNSSNIISKFFFEKTQKRKNIGLIVLACYYLTKNNSLGLPQSSQWRYDGLKSEFPIQSTWHETKESATLTIQKKVLDGKLFLLSRIIELEFKNLTPMLYDLPKLDMHRTTLLWYYYFNKGIYLSSGGVINSFLNLRSFEGNPNLESFSMYRSDRQQSTTITQDTMKRFLLEENAITSKAIAEKLNFSFCLGSHEGSMRAARCIYDRKKNNGIFYPIGSYGIMASGFATMKPVPYLIYMVDIDRRNGEKIILENLIFLSKKHPSARTLFLELKTTAGIAYNIGELSAIIDFCKSNEFFIIFDAAHINMNLTDEDSFPDVVTLCKNKNYYDFVAVYTCSKTYGLERGRVGFIVTSKQNRISNLYTKMEIDLYRVHGSLGDLPFEIANLILNSEIEKRKNYLKINNEMHRFNMNLMLGYIEGIESNNLDRDISANVQREIPEMYWRGIPGISVICKPKFGIQMKISTAGLYNKFLSNIRMFNAEVFSYSLNIFFGIVTLHSFQVLDPSGFGVRLSFSNKDDVHYGMRKMHEFVKLLSDQPVPNKFLPGVFDIEKFILHKKREAFGKQLKEHKFLEDNWSSLKRRYAENIRSIMLEKAVIPEKEIDSKIENAAKIIQRAFRKKRLSFFDKNNSKNLLSLNSKPGLSLQFKTSKL